MSDRIILFGIIALIIVMGLVGSDGPRIDAEELMHECDLVEEKVGGIIWELEDIKMQADDIWESTTLAWALLSGQEPYDEELHKIAVQDLESGWKVYDELFSTVYEIQCDIEDAGDSIEYIRSVIEELQ